MFLSKASVEGFFSNELNRYSIGSQSGFPGGAMNYTAFDFLNSIEFFLELCEELPF